MSWELGWRSPIDTASNTATEAENRPVWDVMLAHEARRAIFGTHKDENPIGICFPAVGHLVVFILCYLQILVEERC